MTERTLSLFPSLVGSSIEFKEKSTVLSIDGNIDATKRKIESEIDDAFLVGGELCVILLSELTSFYSKESYYMALRSSIRMRRYRPKVIDYLTKLTVSERADNLTRLLRRVSSDKYRSVLITALKYFLNIYPNRIRNFKPLLTREELSIVC